MKKTIAIIALAAAVGGCASLSDCNKYSGNQYNNCVREFHEQDARMAAALRSGMEEGAQRRSEFWRRNSEMYKTTCTGVGGLTSCTTTRF